MSARRLPPLSYDPDDGPLPDAEVVAVPVPAGREIELWFPSPYEPFLVLDGVRVTEDHSPEHRAVLSWLYRRMPRLSQLLGQELGLRGVLVQYATRIVQVTDIAELPGRDDDGEGEGFYVSAEELRRRLSDVDVNLPALAFFGPISSRTELDRRLRAAWAPGTHVEVRVEDGGRVVSRRRVRVGRTGPA